MYFKPLKNNRYACHLSELLTEDEKQLYPLNVSPIAIVNENLEKRYKLAMSKARKIGGKRWVNKHQDNMVEFQTPSLAQLKELIQKELL